MLLSYKNKEIFITPDDENETKKIMTILNEAGLFFSGRAEYLANGKYRLYASLLPTLNKILIPLKDNIRQDDEFKNYVAMFKEQYVKSGSNVKKGLLIVKGVNTCQIIGPKSLVPKTDIEKRTRYFFEGAKNSKKFKEGK